jgi:hypothetical protein
MFCFFTFAERNIDARKFASTTLDVDKTISNQFCISFVSYENEQQNSAFLLPDYVFVLLFKF